MPEPADVTLFCNLSQRPYINNLLPAVAAFERAARLRVVDPLRYPAFTSTGGARPAAVPDEAIADASRGHQPGGVVVCLGGALHVPAERRARFGSGTTFVGVALSDPLGLDASLDIAATFDLFYTQDPQSMDEYRRRGIPVRRCDLAIDPRIYRPLGMPATADVIFYGRWTAQRDALVSRLARRCDVALHAYEGETRWSVPARPPLDTPEDLCAGINRARLALEAVVLDNARGRFHMSRRMTPRVQFAAACGVPCLIQDFPALRDFFEPGEEVEVFSDSDDLVRRTLALLGDEPRRKAMGVAARRRVEREQTWDLRVSQILGDVRELRERSPGTSAAGRLES